MTILLFCLSLDLSDNLTEMRVVKNSIQYFDGIRHAFLLLIGLCFFFQCKSVVCIVISRFQSNSNVLYLINCGNKSKSFLSFISFIGVTQHRVQVSCTSSHTSQNLIHAAYAAQYKLLSSFTNSLTAKAVPHMLSSVLTDAMQMLPSAVNLHIKGKSISICL